MTKRGQGTKKHGNHHPRKFVQGRWRKVLRTLRRKHEHTKDVNLLKIEQLEGVPH